MRPANPLVLLRIILAIGMASGPALAAAPLLPGQFQAHVENGRTEMHQAPQVLANFDALFAAAGSVESLPDETLAKLAADAAIANFYFAGARADAHGVVFAELVRRNQVTDLQIDDYHRSLVAARRWQDAATVARENPLVPLATIPVHIEAGGDEAGAHYWRFDPATDRLVREPLAAASGVTLVVVSHPGCHFSRDAIAAIENDPALDQALPERRIFVAPSYNLDLDGISKWNVAHPSSRHVLVDRPLAWPFVHKWTTPQFFFLVDGEPVAWVEGWPEEGQVEALLAASRKAAAP